MEWGGTASSHKCSVTRFGDFLKFLATNVTLKLAQIFVNFLGNFEVSHSYRKNTILITFWVSIGKFGLLLIPTSGHTDGNEWNGAKKTKRIKITQMKQSSSVRIPALHTT